MGFGEENGILIIGLGVDRLAALDVKTGTWTPLPQASVAITEAKFLRVFAVEMKNPFRYPFVRNSFHSSVRFNSDENELYIYSTNLLC